MGELVLDPIAAYNRLASEYAAIAHRRGAYLAGIERLVIANIPTGAASMLDVGAGDGKRALRIAKAAGIEAPTLLEPSENMRTTWPDHVKAWPIAAAEMSQSSGRFDVITCLWNVLGHLFPASARLHVLTQMKRLLAPGGRIFIDVSHRYNARHYGWIPTLFRMSTDWLRRPGKGDVLATWHLQSGTVVTKGHVFTRGEARTLFAAAGLKIEDPLAVDYATGEVVPSAYLGHLFFLLRS